MTDRRFHIRIILCVVLGGSFLTGCHKQTTQKEIEINVVIREDPNSGMANRFLKLTLMEDRDLFLRFRANSQKSGWCSPPEVLARHHAHEALSVQFWDNPNEPHEINILASDTGEWLPVGFGGAELLHVPEGFPEYSLEASSLKEVREWAQIHSGGTSR